MSSPSSLLNVKVLHPNFVIEVDERIERLLDSDAAMAELRRLWRNWSVMIFRRQSLEEDEQVRFSNYFGSCESASRKERGTMPAMRVHAAGSPTAPRFNSACAVERTGGRQPRRLTRSPALNASVASQRGIFTSRAGLKPSQRRKARTISTKDNRSGPASSRAVFAGASSFTKKATVFATSSRCTTCNAAVSGKTGMMPGNAAAARRSALPP